MPVRGLVVGIPMAKQTFPVRFRTVDACSFLNDYHQIAIHIKCGPTKGFNYASSQFIAITYTSEFAKIRKVFTKGIYLFDSVSMERLKSAVQSALTKRKLSITLKKEQMECRQVMVNHLFSNFCPIYTIIYFRWKVQWCWLYLRLTP